MVFKSISCFNFIAFLVFTVGCSKSSNNNSNPASENGMTINTLSSYLPESQSCLDTSATFCATEEIENNTAQVTFAPSGGTITNLVVSFPSGTSNEWTLDSSQCVEKIKTSCIVTVTYTPTFQGESSGNIALNYSYTNNINKIVANLTTQTMSFQKISLLSNASLSLPFGLSEAKKLSLNKLLPAFGIDAENNFYSLLNKVNPIANIVNYSFAPGNKMVLTNAPQLPYNLPTHSIYDPLQPSQPTLSLSSIVKNSYPTVDPNASYVYATGQTSIYGCEQLSGSIYSINLSNNTATFLNKLVAPNTWVQSCTTDISGQNDVLYTLSRIYPDPTPLIGNEYLCMIAANSPNAMECSTSPVAQFTSYQQPNSLAVNGIYYLATGKTNGGAVQIQAFTSSGGALVPYPSFSTQAIIAPVAPITGVWMSSPMVYDSTNKIIYLVLNTKEGASSSYSQLYAINATTGNINLVKSFTPGEVVSKPFITKNSRVILVSSKNNVYGFEKDGSGAFLSGTFQIPTNMNLALNLITPDATTGNLDIPASNSSLSAIYSLNMQW